jgi:hypothetical protein
VHTHAAALSSAAHPLRMPRKHFGRVHRHCRHTPQGIRSTIQPAERTEHRYVQPRPLPDLWQDDLGRLRHARRRRAVPSARAAAVHLQFRAGPGTHRVLVRQPTHSMTRPAPVRWRGGGRSSCPLRRDSCCDSGPSSPDSVCVEGEVQRLHGGREGQRLVAPVRRAGSWLSRVRRRKSPALARMNGPDSGLQTQSVQNLVRRQERAGVAIRPVRGGRRRAAGCVCRSC